MENELNIKENRYLELGVVLYIIAPSLSNVIRLILRQNIDSTPFFLIVSLIMICDWRNVASFKFNLLPKSILVYLTYALISAFIMGIPFWDTYGISYTVVGLAFVLLLFTNNKTINYDFIIKIIFWGCGFLNLLLVSNLTDGFSSIGYALINGLYDSNNNIIANRVTLSLIPYLVVISSLLIKHTSTKKIMFFKIINIGIAILGLLAVNRRSYFVFAILVLIVLLYFKSSNNIKISINNVFKFLFFVIGIILVVYFLYKTTTFKEMLDSYWSSTLRAITTLFNPDQALDQSASIRNGIRTEMIYEYGNASIIQLIFGFGFMHRYLDFPVFQAVVDLGLFAGCLYFFIQVLYPLLHILKKPSDPCVVLLSILCIESVGGAFVAGIPYGTHVFVYVALLMFVDKHSKRSNLNENFIPDQHSITIQS